MLNRRYAIPLSFSIGLSLIILVLGLIALPGTRTAKAMSGDEFLVANSIPLEAAMPNKIPAEAAAPNAVPANNIPAGPLGFFSLAPADDTGARFQTIGANGVSIFFPNQPRSFYNGGNFAFVGFTPWYPTAPVVGAPGTQAANEGWGNLLKTYVAAVYLDAPDNPNPPLLKERVDTTAGPTDNPVYLPLVVR